MSLSQLTDREAVLRAIREFDELGREQFLEKHGFGPARRYFVVHEGRRYDSKALAGVAYSYQFPQRDLLRASEFSGGEGSVGKVFGNLGFEVIDQFEGQIADDLRKSLEEILRSYIEVRAGGKFGKAHPIWSVFEEAAESIRSLAPVATRPHLKVSWSAGQGAWSRVPMVALMDERETSSTQDGVYVVFLFREDMSGVYLSWNQGVTSIKKEHGARRSREILRERAASLSRFHGPELRGFQVGDGMDLRSKGTLGRSYEAGAINYKLYKAEEVPRASEIAADLEFVLSAYDQYLELETASTPEASSAEVTRPQAPFDLQDAMEELISRIQLNGYVFEPWQVGQYVTALRTKPFVILAGVSGTGKSTLPRLVAEGTGGCSELIPVRPDWSDSSEILGYTDLHGTFRPGPLLTTARSAEDNGGRLHTLVIDEMNLARVEHYFAEVLSRIEDRRVQPGGGYGSPPLLETGSSHLDHPWSSVRIPPNLAIVGTVNMDESTHGFSRKVLDRAFTIELSDVSLEMHQSKGPAGSDTEPTPWPVEAWWPRAARLGEPWERTKEDEQTISEVVSVLSELNGFLSAAQLQVAYRVRDEIALFVIHAKDISSTFRTSSGQSVAPLDLALQMKILPRITGGSGAVQRALLGLLGWAKTGSGFSDTSEAREITEAWISRNRPSRIEEARFPGLAARCALMWERLQSEGYTSYWL